MAVRMQRETPSAAKAGSNTVCVEQHSLRQPCWGWRSGMQELGLKVGDGVVSQKCGARGGT